jgi:cholesterol transport system auxiliary component
MLTAAAALSGCGALAGIGTPAKLFRLTSLGPQDRPPARVAWQLLIPTPLADPGLDTARIALSTGPTNVDYFAGVSWADRMPEMIQTALVESFENSGAIAAVGRDTALLRADYLLNVEIRGFQADYDGPPPGAGRIATAHVRFGVKLVALGTRAIVAGTTFDARDPAAGDTLEATVAAFDRALHQVLSHVVDWTLKAGQEAAQGAGEAVR